MLNKRSQSQKDTHCALLLPIGKSKFQKKKKNKGTKEIRSGLFGSRKCQKGIREINIECDSGQDTLCKYMNVIIKPM